jgi:hypothetical protein
MLNKIASKYLQKVAEKGSFNPYETFDTLVKYYETNPEEGKTAKDSALYHLGKEFNKAINKEFAGTGSSIFTPGDKYEGSVYKSDVPLGSRLGWYASDIKNVVNAFPDMREMEIVWDTDGDPILVYDVNADRINLNRTKYSYIDDITDSDEFDKALAKVLDNQAFKFRAKRAPSAKGDKEKPAKQK